MEQALNQFSLLRARKAKEFAMTLVLEPKDPIAVTCQKAAEMDLALDTFTVPPD